MSKRGYDEQDKRWFSKSEVMRLSTAKEEIEWLLNRDYPLTNVIKFVSDRYQFSNRQRDVLKRTVCTDIQKQNRLAKQLPLTQLPKGPIYIDGFNLIITLEVALSGGTLLCGSDGSIRDLAGLRGTYRLLEQTDVALNLLAKVLMDGQVEHVIFYLDAPVSNSRNLKYRIHELSKHWSFETEVELVPNPDVILQKFGRVVSSDAIILDACDSYFNLLEQIISDSFPGHPLLTL